MTTIIVSPMARLTPRRMPPMMPGRAAGSRTFVMVSLSVAPMASEPSFIARGTAFSASSDSDEMNGMIMMPITDPAARAEFGEMRIGLHGMSSQPPPPLVIQRMLSRSAGATTRMAKKP